MNVYVIGDAGRSAPMNRIRCSNEAFELHDLIENNCDLIPGDQIDPDEPRRWLLIKREMPVPDPNTGSNRWSIDFVLADQDAVPTFVECKRFFDTRSRREVVGQMLEYAANGQHYWSRDTLQKYADDTARVRNQTLESSLRTIQPTDDVPVSVFFERLEDNLREGRVRLVFVLEESPFELRSVVDFLNKQMELTEVLVVELRQFVHGDTKVAVPSLFGYTEEARRVKQTPTMRSSTRKKWDEASFFADVRSRCGEADYLVIQKVLAGARELGCEVTWGTGVTKGSFSIKEPAICQPSLITVYSTGELSFNFVWLNRSGIAEQVRDRMKELAAKRLDLEMPQDYASKWLVFPVSEWGAKADYLVKMLKELLSEFREASA